MTRASSESAQHPGTLTLAAWPAGDAADVTARLRAALATAGLIVTADARRLRRLAAALDIPLAGRVATGVADPVAVSEPALLAELSAGQHVLLVSGTADGAAELTAAAAAAGIAVTALPGPSAVTAALAAAGLPAERFTVEGCPPRGAEQRERRFGELAAEPRTLIFRESSRRVSRMLAELAAAFGPSRLAAVCRDLAADGTDVVRGPLGELASQLTGGAGGEVTVVVAGAPPAGRGGPVGEPGEPDEPDEPGAGGEAGGAGGSAAALADAVAQVRAQVAGGATTRDAVALVAATSGLRRRDLYNAVGSSRRSGETPAGPPRRSSG
ncbi:MAG TPA: SAM-dependent methyltransferase [Streptosporangiaceae bacterium]|nr:SAM-dependent methyltransferase [Streptosporangiaceae bacterium]